MKTMNKWRSIVTGVSALALVSLSGISTAEESANSDKDCGAKHQGYHRHGGQDKQGGHSAHLVKALDLSAEQKQTFAKYKQEQRDLNRQARKQLRQSHQALQKAVTENASEAEISQLAGQVGELTAEHLVARARDRQFLMSILTDEQKSKMAELRSERKHRWLKKDVDSKV